MKKILSIMAAALLFNTAAYAISEDLTVYYNDIDVYEQTTEKPFIMNNRTLVPLKPIFTTMGIAEDAIDYDEGTQTATFTGDVTVSFTNNSPTAKLIEGDKELDHELYVPATVHNGKFFVPLRDFCDIWDIYIEWVEEEKSVYIYGAEDEEADAAEEKDEAVDDEKENAADEAENNESSEDDVSVGLEDAEEDTDSSEE